MKTPQTKNAAWPEPASGNERGHGLLPPSVDPSGRLTFVRTKKNRAPSTRGAVVRLGL
jgi:hypothetical protein